MERVTILGVHILGAHATDLIHEAALAMQAGTMVSRVAEMIHAPTLAEGLMEAMEDVHGHAIHLARKPIHVMRAPRSSSKVAMLAVTLGALLWIASGDTRDEGHAASGAFAPLAPIATALVGTCPLRPFYQRPGPQCQPTGRLAGQAWSGRWGK